MRGARYTDLYMGRILVTGGSGFIGAHLVQTLKARGDETYAPSHHELDITDREAVAAYVQKIKPSQVFHLATSTLISGKTADYQTVLRTNVEGSIALLDAASVAGVISLVQMGSFVEYGPKQEPLREDMRCEPVETYAVSKLAATLYGQGLAKRTSFPAITMRLFTPYGPGIQEGRLVRTLLEKIAAGEPIPLSSPDIARDFIYVDDIVSALLEVSSRASALRGEVFNLGSGECTALSDLVSLAEHVIGKKADVQWDAYPVQSYDSKLWQADMQKTFAALTWRPQVTLSEGLTRTFAWLS